MSTYRVINVKAAGGIFIQKKCWFFWTDVQYFYYLHPLDFPDADAEQRCIKRAIDTVDRLTDTTIDVIYQKETDVKNKEFVIPL